MEIQTKLTRGGGRAEMLARDPRPDADKVDELFLWAFGRPASLEHRQIAIAHVERHGKDKRAAYQDLIWALINTKEFVFNQCESRCYFSDIPLKFSWLGSAPDLHVFS